MQLQPGTLILNGKFRVGRRVGGGASAEVYEATQVGLDAPRALKILRRDLPGVGSTEVTEYAARFALEGRLQARLKGHPRIVQVYDTDTLEGAPVLIMEYCEGGSLETELDEAAQRGKLMSIARIVEVMQDIADGLAELHRMNCVHRDIKPGNVLLDGAGRAKIGDLGLAQVAGLPSIDRSGWDAPHHPGTPGYASPEHAVAHAYLTPRADIFALGVVGYRMLTGRMPDGTPPARRPQADRSDVPDWLDALVLRMLDRDPGQRPEDGGTVVELIRRERQADVERVAQRAVRARALRAQIEAALNARELGQADALLDELRSLIPETPEYLKLERRVNLAILAERNSTVAIAPRAPAPVTQPVPAEDLTQGVALIDSAPPRVEAGDGLRRNVADRMALVLAPGIEVDFVRVPEGEFLYGDSKEKRRSEAFWIGRAPVTTAQFLAFVGETEYKRAHAYYGSKIARAQLTHPAKCVSWDEAKAWCDWASLKTGMELRLPTEVEWEKAVRGTDGRLYPWGNAEPTSRHANFAKGDAWVMARGDDDWTFSTPVGKFSPVGDSPFGLVEAAGNVWEWCADWYDADKKARVLRGGSFFFTPQLLPIAYRHRDLPFLHFDNYGFRVIAHAPPAA